MENFHFRQLFAHTHKLDGRAGNSANGESSATARIAVHLGEHHAGNAKALVKAFGHGHGVLTGHGVGNKQNFLGLHRLLDGGQFLHENFIHMQSASRIEQQHSGLLFAGFFKRSLGNVHGVHIYRGGIARYVELFGQHCQLVNGRRAVHVGRYKVGPHFLLAQNIGNLASRGCFTRALQTHKHDNRRFAALQVKPCGFAAKQLHELIVNNLDHLLGRANTLEHLLPQALFAHAFHKVFNDLEVDVRLKQGKAHFAQASLHVFFGKLPAPAECAEYA